MRFNPLTLLLLVIPLFSGCGAPVAADDPFEPLQAFEATYEYDAEPITLTMRLSQSQIQDADLQVQAAYQLRIETNDTRSTALTHWISGDFREIAFAYDCSSDCLFPNQLNWVARGSWAPMGVAHDRLYRAGERTQTIWGRVDDVIWRADAAGSHLHLAESGPWLGQASYFGYGYNLTYDDSAAPQRISNEYGTWTRISLKTGDQLPAVPKLRLIGDVRMAHNNGAWFPDSDRPLLGNVSFDQAMAAMTATVPTFSNALAQDCLAEILLDAPFQSFFAGAGINLLSESHQKFKVGTYASGSSTMQVWSAEYSEPPIGEPSWSFEGPEDVPQGIPFQCVPGRMANRTAQGVQGVLDAARGLPQFDGQAVSGIRVWGQSYNFVQVAPDLDFTASISFEARSTGSIVQFPGYANAVPAVGLWIEWAS